MNKSIGLLLWVIVVFIVEGITEGKMMSSNVTETLDFLLASNRYDKRLRPGFGGPPITISVNFFIKSMGPVSDNDQSFGLDCYFRQHWYDWRLQYQKLPGLDEFSMSWLFLDRVWKPDTYFVNGKKSFLHRITAPNKFLRLRPDGYITYSMRLTISASCPMYLRKFPLDAQKCPLILGSYGYSNKDLHYKWTDEASIGLQEGVEIAQFDLVNITTNKAKIMVKGGLQYSTLQADFWLKRHTGYFMLQVYVPCGLIVLSSWVSFWIDPDDVAARVALGVTTVLSLTTMGFGGRAQMPKVSYWTALDWFVIICFTSVFSVMIEYAVVNFKVKLKNELKKINEKKKAEEAKSSELLTTTAKEELSTVDSKDFAPKKRSSSFSFYKSDKVEEEKKENVNEQNRKITIETKSPASCLKLDSGKKIPKKRVTAVVTYLKPLEVSKVKWKSIPTINVDTVEKETERSFKSKMTHVDKIKDSIDVNEKSGEVILDVGVQESFKGSEEESVKETAPFMKMEIFSAFWKSFKVYPKKMFFVEDATDPSGKFSTLDVQSRKSFPVAFIISLIIYLLAFTYYLSDDVPEISSELSSYNN